MFMKKIIKNLKGPIFVIGAGGFIGSNLLMHILKYREDAYGLVRNETNLFRLNFLKIQPDNILVVDVLDKRSLENVISQFSPKTIFNLTAYGSNSNQTDSETIYRTNILGLLNIFESTKSDCLIINTGSSSEYGFNSEMSSEKDPLEPNSHYSVSKVASSYLIKFYAKTKKRLALNLRLYSIYGPLENSERLIPKLIDNAFENKLPELVDKDISRDFVYIDDCIEGILSAANNLNLEISGNSYNICSGKNISIEEIVRIIRSTFNVSDEPKWGSMKNRNWDRKVWSGNPERTTKDIGWTSSFNLKEGLQKFYSWKKKSKENEIVNYLDLSKKKISAVIACYKDGEAINEMNKRLTHVFNELNVNYEIIFVNDGSPDNSEELIKKICLNNHNVIGITHSRNFGSQAAFMSGMEISTGDAVVLLDGDLQDPPELINEFYKKWTEGFKVVYGVRVKREMNSLFNLFYKSFYSIFSSLSYINIPKNAGDFSMIDRDVVDRLLLMPEKEQFIRGLRAWVGFKQTGVDYIRPKRPYGRSTNSFFKNIWWAKKAIFSFTFQPLSLMSYLGVIITFISFFGIVIQIFLRITYPDTPSGFTTVIVLVLFLGGINLLAISFVGEYISKIFEETKRRPKFIREKIFIKDKIYSTQSDFFNINELKKKKTLIKK